MKKIWAKGIAFTWTLFIGASCLLPPSTFQHFSFQSLFQFDKLIHFFVFYWFVIFWLLSIDSQKVTAKNKGLILLLSITYGYLIEVVQNTNAIGRSFELADVFADGIGALFGVLSVSYFINKILPFLKKRLPFIQKLY